MDITPELITEPPLAGTELEALIGSLDRMRYTFRWKCADLDVADMARTLGPSAISLGGLVRHLTRAEASTFVWKLGVGPEPGSSADWAADWQWTAESDVAAAWARWWAAVARSKQVLADVVAHGGLDAPGLEFPGWGRPNVRRIVIDMIEEYSRHTGHADLIRESIDGRVGEDVPEA